MAAQASGWRQRWAGLRTGEKVVFGVVVLFILVAVVNYVILETVRQHSDQPMFPVRTHYDFSGDGFRGSELFRKSNCTDCHRAVGNGTSMGLNLDGIGSRHDLDYLERFLVDPEAAYKSRTVAHGPAPKEAAYVALLPQPDRHAIAVFLSQLRSDRGAASAQLPPQEGSGIIDAFLDWWAPDSWRLLFSDVRNKDEGKAPPQGGAAPRDGNGKGQ